jgi:glucokinase
MIIGIDIGGTKITFGRVEGENIVGKVFAHKTPNTVEGIINIFNEGVSANLPAKAIGIATAGTVDLENSRVTGSTGNMPAGYRGLEIKKILEEKFHIPVLVENDANAAAYAEYKVGNAVGHNNTITLTLGTGIGGGIIVEGKLLRGRTGAGAEVGHIPISLEKHRQCSCGAWDCWEAYASGTGYALNARELAAKVPLNERKGVLSGDIANLTTHALVEALKRNDPFAIKVHELWEDYLSIGMAALINIFEPDSVVLSGGMAKFVDYDALRRKVKERLVIAETEIIPAKFENCAGMIGAAYLAQEKLL